jgi:hypothetical protein
VYVPVLAREVTVLIDSGSEVNLVEQWVAEAAQWQMIPRPGWTIHTATWRDDVMGACANVEIGVANFINRYHVFVQPEVGYPIVLGQP